MRNVPDFVLQRWIHHLQAAKVRFSAARSNALPTVDLQLQNSKMQTKEDHHMIKNVLCRVPVLSAAVVSVHSPLVQVACQCHNSKRKRNDAFSSYEKFRVCCTTHLVLHAAVVAIHLHEQMVPRTQHVQVFRHVI
jgi:hypothetical protein